eukprot:2993724-Pleurochrysis_carterae.AAC.5
MQWNRLSTVPVFSPSESPPKSLGGAPQPASKHNSFLSRAHLLHEEPQVAVVLPRVAQRAADVADGEGAHARRGTVRSTRDRQVDRVLVVAARRRVHRLIEDRGRQSKAILRVKIHLKNY